MTAGGGQWAEAEVGVTLNWDNVDGELRDRLERASAQAAQVVRKNWAKLEAATRKSFDRMASSFARAMRKVETDAERHANAVGRTWSVTLTRMVARTEVATAKIRAALAEIPRNIPVNIAITQTGMQAGEIRRLSTALTRLQQVGDVTTTVSVVTTGASPEDLRALASALRKVSKFQSMQLVLDVKVNGLAEVERLAAALRALPRSQTVNVNANTSAISKLRKALSGDGLLGAIAGVAGGFVSAGTTMLKWMSIAGGATVVIAGMLPALSALGAALGAGLFGAAVAGAGAFAAGLTAIAGVVATVKTATLGVGEAIKNAFDPANAEKFAEAMAKLSPEAKSFVLAFQQLGKQFKEIVQQPVQDAFFAGLAPQIAGLQTKLVPLRDMMLDIADGFNEGAKSALGFINSATGTRVVGDLLREAGNMGANLGTALGNLVPGLAAIGAGASQVFGPMTNGIGGAARELSNMLVAAQQSGAMQTFFREAIATAKQLWFVLQQVGGIISAVFSAAAEAGNGVLGGMAEKLQQINAYLSAGEGRDALIQFFTAMQSAVATVLPIVLQLATIIGTTVAPALAGLITQIGPSISGLVDMLGQGMANLAPAMAPLGAAISAIATAIGPVLPVLGTLLATFAQLAGPIIAALAQALGPVLVTVGNALISILQALMPAVQPLSELFIALGPVIGQLAQVLAGALIGALNTAVPVFIMLVNAATSLMPVVVGLLQMLAPLAPVIGAIAAAVGILVLGFKAAAIITKIINAIKTAWLVLQIAFALSPIGMIITGIVALIGALALFFTKTELGKQIWEKVMGALKATWDVIWPALKAGFDAIGAAAMWLWQNAIQPAFSAIGSIFSFLWGAVKVYFTIWQTLFKLAGAVVMWLWQNAIQPAFQFIGQIIGAVWNGVIKPIFDLFMGGLRAVGDAAMWLWQNAIRPAWDFIQGAIEKVWNFVRPIFGKIGDAFRTMGDIASRIGSAIKDAFSGVVDVIKAPIHAIGRLLAALPDSILGVDIPGVASIKAFGQTMQGLRDGGPVQMKLQSFAGGSHGPIQGPGTTTSDSILARLSRGEYVLPAVAVNPRTLPFIEALRAGWVPPAGLLAAMPAFATGGPVGREPYGLPAGSSVSYGDNDGLFPQWVRDIEKRFGVQASTYAGHQEKSGKNKGIDWSGPVPNMQRLAEYFRSIKGDLEQVIWMNPNTGEKIGVADGQMVGPGTSQPGYYSADWSGHTDHVHTRQSYSLGGTPSPQKGIATPGSTASASSGLGGTTPIGSGLGASTSSGSSSSGTSGGAQWGNSGGTSKFNTADEADKGGVIPVWVENWPAMIGGGGGGGAATLGGTTDPAVGLTGTPAKPSGVATEDTIPLVKNPDGTYSSPDPAWNHLLKRESGGRMDRKQEIIDANSGGNEASGGFQIALGTWKANGGLKFAPTAGQATPEEQAIVAARIFNKSGGSPWGAGLAGREDEAKLRAGIVRKGKPLPGSAPAPAPAPAPTPGNPMPVEVTNTPEVTPTTDPAAAPAAPANAPKRPEMAALTLGGSPLSGQLGGAAKSAIAYGVDTTLFDNPGALGKFDNSKAKTSLGTRAGDVAGAAISGQLSSALGIIGLDLQPPAVDAIGQYITDNPLTTAPAAGEQPATQKNLVDLVSDLARQAWEAGSVSVVVQGNADGDDVANKVDNGRRRRMRRYVKPSPS
ncbi:tail length tape measure protein [Gordonia phage Angelicage]|uniref:Tape measure protein n=1 Tax=Gordonia phage Angelicage TaxID=2301695 RepID=A0A385DW79_9CAUD|nr:tail length tape measure protein [Gordonia phage Angelicage]AXQ62819.1 tape measure protein [Gordonia phage Angelicage]